MAASGYGPWDNDVGEEYLWTKILDPLYDTFHRALNPAEMDNPRGNLDKARSAAAVLVLIVRARPELLNTRAAVYLMPAAEQALVAVLESHPPDDGVDYVDNYHDPHRARETIQEEIAALRALKGAAH